MLVRNLRRRRIRRVIDNKGPLREADACYLKKTIKTGYSPVDWLLEKRGSLEEATTEFRGEQ
jgi:hypothetical protein